MERFAGTSAEASARRAIRMGKAAFGANWTPERIALAPGRIELLGNHLDYNGGPVLAAAIDRFIAVASRLDAGAQPELRAVAADAPGNRVAGIDASSLIDWRNPKPPPTWPDYLRGLLAAMQQPRSGKPAHPARLPASLAIAGDVPIGFGVSSSAALCVALTMSLSQTALATEAVVLLAQEAEHRAGTPCGTMDQSASVAGGVIAFDGATLTSEWLSPSLDDLVFLVADSGVERSLGASSYPTRVAESRQALTIAQNVLGIDLPNLAALTRDQLDELTQRTALPPTLANRARHVVEETARVYDGRRAMLAGDWARFGALMTASGRSSASLYEISHPRVEELVGEALAVQGVLGARMMGGGEGGSALILAPHAAIAGLEDALRSRYYQRYGMEDRKELLHACAFASGAAALPASAIAGLS